MHEFAALPTAPAAPRLPRPVLLARLLWRCLFCVLAVVAGNGVLTAVPQAREALLLFAGQAGHSWPQASFYVGAVVYWAASAWFVSRLLLGRRFGPDTLGADADDPYAEWVATVLPRVLAFMATLPLTLLTWQADRALGAWVGLASAVFIIFVVFRRKFGDTANRSHQTYGEFTRLGPNAQQACLGFLAFSAVLLLGLWFHPAAAPAALAWALAAWGLHRRALREGAHEATRAGRRRLLPLAFAANLLAAAGTGAAMVHTAGEIDLARLLGSPALLLYALGSWTLFGGLAMTYLPMTRGWPGVALWLPVLLMSLGSLHEGHWVAQRPLPPRLDGHPGGPLHLPCGALAPPANAAASASAPAPDDWRRTRCDAVEHFAGWMAQHAAGEPVYLVAVVGGASRAAYWAASVLTQLEEDARAAGRSFGTQVYALSSISGGSLGAAAWVADLAQHPVAGARAPAQPGEHRRRVLGFLSEDVLSPVVGRMLFPDLLSRFVPVGLPDSWLDRADRSLGLEQAWRLDWQRLQAHAGTGTEPSPAPAALVDWGRPLTELYDTGVRNGASRLPSLLLNTVRLDDGHRFVQSNLATRLPGVYDLLDAGFDTRQLSLAQAVHNSARFPYVSPGAVLLAPGEGLPRQDRTALGRLGDGGYHEGSGAATLADLLDHLRDAGQLRERHDGRRGLWACRGGWPSGAGTCPTAPSPVVVLIIDSEAAGATGSHVRDEAGAEQATGQGFAQAGMPLPELLAPVFGGLSTRTELGRLSQRRLSHRVGGDPRAFIELRMPYWRSIDDARAGLDPDVPAGLGASEPGVSGTPAGAPRPAAPSGQRPGPPDAEREADRTACARRGDAQPSMNWALDRCSRARLRAAVEIAAAPLAASTVDSPVSPAPTTAQRILAAHLGRLRELVVRGAPVAWGAE